MALDNNACEQIDSLGVSAKLRNSESDTIVGASAH